MDASLVAVGEVNARGSRQHIDAYRLVSELDDNIIVEEILCRQPERPEAEICQRQYQPLSVALIDDPQPERRWSLAV